MTTVPALLSPWQLADLPLARLFAEASAVNRAACRQEIRLAVLGDGATQHYARALASVLKLRGFWPELYEAEFDTIRQEVLDSGSGLYRHHARFVLFFPCLQALQDRVAGRANAPELVEAAVGEIAGLWDRVLDGGDVTVLQHNLCVPIERPFGNRTSAQPTTLAYAVERANCRLAEEADRRRGVRLIDTDFQASYFGKRHWLDERLWCQARQACSPAFLPPLAKAVSDALLLEMGVGVKCVVLDLDNTLWGGILGDDGLHGIEIGSTEIGLVFRRIQAALAGLKDRGVLLAVCSKNREDLARSVFASHPDMVLREQDFVAFVANFEEKRENILAIRDALNVGLDAFVFLDDSPFERELVRRSLPEVQVPELPEDPAEVLTVLPRWNLFEAAEVTAEDRVRLGSYRAEVSRRALGRHFADLDSYLESLDMEAEVRPFDAFSLPRAHQLVQRSNQFNLTTRRRSAAELGALARDPSRATFTLRLRDRLGDSGIVVAVIAQARGGDLVVDTWIMSCRVLGRRLEELTLAVVVEEAVRRGCRRIVGEYRPTEKNGMVAELYPRLGFSALPEEGDGRHFALEVEGYRAPALPIRISAEAPKA